MVSWTNGLLHVMGIQGPLGPPETWQPWGALGPLDSYNKGGKRSTQKIPPVGQQPSSVCWRGFFWVTNFGGANFEELASREIFGEGLSGGRRPLSGLAKLFRPSYKPLFLV